MPSTFARTLCATPTDAEVWLWWRLRRKQIDGFRFRGQHAADNERLMDWLEERGYRVIRFWNNEVLANTDGTLQAISETLHQRPPPGDAKPSPASPSRGEALDIQMAK
jgi:very-short-patch-repair endonuclease